MGTFAELWDATAPTQPSVKEAPTKIAPNVQAKRDQDALGILQNELKASQDKFASATDPQAKMRHQADIAGLQKEIGRLTKTATPTEAPSATPAPVPAPASPAADSTNFADIWESITAKPTQTSTAGAGRGTYQGYSATAEAAGKTKQIKNKYFGKEISPEDVINLSTTMPAEAESDLRPLYEVPRAIAQNLLATAASGYGAIAKGIQTGSLQQAGDG